MLNELLFSGQNTLDFGIVQQEMFNLLLASELL